MDQSQNNICKMSVPTRIVGKKAHCDYVHIICVLTRVLLGMFIMLHGSNKYINVLMVLIVMTFSYLYLNNVHTSWKSQLRTVIAYTSSIVLVSKQKNDLAGMLVVVDALIGHQSRHTATLFKD